MGANPFDISARWAPRRAGNLELLIVHEMFLTETAQQADIVLPAASGLRKRRHGDQHGRRNTDAAQRRGDHGDTLGF